LARVIAVTNQKGGVGKTTTSINLSTYIAYEGYKVLLIDLDPQGNASSGLGIDCRRDNLSVYNLLIKAAQVEQVIQSTTIKQLDIIPANIDLAGAEIEIASQKEREYILRDTISDIKPEYDYIIIDCPPSLGLLTINALVAADSVLIPIQCEYYALEGLSRLLDTVEAVKKRLNSKLSIEGIAFTLFDGRTNLGIQVVDEVKKHFSKQVYRSIIPRNVRLSEAPSHGKPIALYDPKSKGAEAYKDLAREVIKRDQARKGFR
jgi:chromosome partitioning protein